MYSIDYDSHVHFIRKLGRWPRAFFSAIDW